jgi:hypothetical protein
VDWPICTGEVCKLLAAREYQLTNQIRLGKVSPPLLMGRRAWMPDHVLAVARILGRDSIELRNALQKRDGGAHE